MLRAATGRTDHGRHRTPSRLVADDHRDVGIAPAAGAQVAGGETFVGQGGGGQVGQRGQALGPPGPEVQNSVWSESLAWMALYSGLWVRGMSDISLPMLPVTFILPCMNAAFGSSSPFSTFTESS